ncbi:MAG: O-antigen ligase family protein [Candidatus Kapaibacteriales bacterium]
MAFSLKTIYINSFWFIYITQFAFGFSLFNFFAYGFTLLDINILFCLILLIFAVLVGQKGLKVAINPPNLFLLLFNVSIFLSFTVIFITNSALNNFQLLKSTAHYYYVFSFILLVFSPFLQPEIYFKKIIPTLIILLIIFNLYGIYQLFARIYNLPFAWIEYTNKGIFSRLEIFTGVQQVIMSYGFFIRATSIFTEPSVLASYNVYLLIFLIIPWIQFRQNFLKSSILTIFFIVISIITLFFTFSMTGVLGFLLVFSLVFFIEKFSMYKKALLIILISFIAIFFANYLTKEFAQIDLLEMFSYRFESLLTLGKEEIGGESFSGRIKNLSQSFKVFTENYLFGVGMGLLGYQPNFEYMFSDASLFSIFAEAGIFAGVLFIATMLSLFFCSIDIYKKVQKDLIKVNSNEKKLIGIIPYIVSFEIFRTFFTVNYVSYFAFWMNIGFAFYVVNYYSKFLNFSYLSFFYRKV